MALQSILADLHQEDYFGIIVFDFDIGPWKQSLVKATKENLAEAIQYVPRIIASGGRKASTWLDIKLPITKSKRLI